MANESVSKEQKPTEIGIREPPQGLKERLKNIGPGIVVSGCIIGSGELIVQFLLLFFQPFGFRF